MAADTAFEALIVDLNTWLHEDLVSSLTVQHSLPKLRHVGMAMNGLFGGHQPVRFILNL